MATKGDNQRITSAQVPDLDELRQWLLKMVAAGRFGDLVTFVVALVARMRDFQLELAKKLANQRRRRPPSEQLDRVERQLMLPLPGLQPAPRKKKRRSERRRRKRPGRNPLPAHLRREEKVIKVPPERRCCPHCGKEMVVVGYASNEKLRIKRVEPWVERTLIERVACRKHDVIVSAAPPPALVERGKLHATLIIDALCDKYILHVPVERQCANWMTWNIDIAPQTLGRGINVALDTLAPIAALIRERVLQPGLLATDATSLPILDPDAPDNIRSGTVWCWTNATWVYFQYTPSADSASVRSFLGKDVARKIQCDGTPTLSFIEREGGQRPGCWSHARRRFVDAARIGDLTALEPLRIIAGLFKVESAAKAEGDTAMQRLQRRREHSQPILDELQEWLRVHELVTPPKTPLGEALGYLRRQWKRLVLFMEDGAVELTNNDIERKLRRLVQGRKNWLFTWLDEGGERTATAYTIIATCIAQGVNPRAYLQLVTELIVGGYPPQPLDELLPHRLAEKHPELRAHQPDVVAPALHAPEVAQIAGSISSPTATSPPRAGPPSAAPP